MAIFMAIAGTLVSDQGAYAGIGCGADTVSEGYFQVDVQRAVFSCDVVAFGIEGVHGPYGGGLFVNAWGPDGIQGSVTLTANGYVNVWSGDHAPGGLWCGQISDEYWTRVCLST